MLQQTHVDSQPFDRTTHFQRKRAGGNFGRSNQSKVRGIGVDISPDDSQTGELNGQPGGPLQLRTVDTFGAQEDTKTIVGFERAIAQKPELAHLTADTERPGGHGRADAGKLDDGRIAGGGGIDFDPRAEDP